MTTKNIEEKLRLGELVTRESWKEGTFICRQIPCTLEVESIVPSMQSLPKAAKQEFLTRLHMSQEFVGDPQADEDFKTIRYKDQIALVKPDNTVTSYVMSNEDLLAVDWKEY